MNAETTLIVKVGLLIFMTIIVIALYQGAS